MSGLILFFSAFFCIIILFKVGLKSQV